MPAAATAPRKRKRPAEEAAPARKDAAPPKKPTALERMLAAQERAASAASSSLGLPAPAPGQGGRRKKRAKMTQAERDEEDEIAWLEAKLGMDRRGAGNNDDEDDGGDDGLGGLIRELDRYQTGMFDPSSNDEEDDDDQSDTDEGSQQPSESDTEEEQDGGGESDVPQNQATAPKEASTPAAPSSGKYIPPALRRAAAAAGEGTAEASAPTHPAAKLSAPTVDPKVQRTLNGLLNRLSSANLDSILADLLAVYRDQPRAIVTSTLVRLVLDTVALQPNLVDSIVILYAALLAALGRSVGIEFGAEAVQVLMGRLVYAHAQIRARQGGSNANGQAESMVAVDGDDRAGRECLNLASLLAHAYNLRLVAAPLIYDVVRLCLREPAAVRAGADLVALHVASSEGNGGTSKPDESSDAMQEIDVEVLLKLVKACGDQMRSDDPSALKDIVALTQERVSGPSSDTSQTSGGSVAALGSRARFMLEALTDLQRARSKGRKGGTAGLGAGGADGTVAAEALARYKKYIGGLAKRPERLLRSSAGAGLGHSDEPLLHIGLRDLADSNKKGRWWLVGAAWTGHGDGEEGDDGAPVQGVTAKRKLGKAEGGSDQRKAAVAISSTAAATSAAKEAGLALLARELGMNTDARRSVFITLMSSEDYLDASQRLLGLGLNEVQRREVVRVLLHCLGSEPFYNPYYVLIGQQLASDAGVAAGGPVLATSSTSGVISTRVTMQYCLWDYFRDIGEVDVGGASMLASGATKAGADSDDEFQGFGDAFGETAAEVGSSGHGRASRKMVHLARGYGWWIAKGALNLNILRTVNFAALKDRGRTFVRLLLIHTLLSILTNSPTKTLNAPWTPEKAAAKHRSAIEAVLVRGTAGNLELARGLLVFVKRHLRMKELGAVSAEAGLKKGTRAGLEWAVGVVEEVLEVGIQVAGRV